MPTSGTTFACSGPIWGRGASLSTEDIERGIERFAATLPAERRLRQLLNASPLHIGRDGKVRD